MATIQEIQAEIQAEQEAYEEEVARRAAEKEATIAKLKKAVEEMQSKRILELVAMIEQVAEDVGEAPRTILLKVREAFGDVPPPIVAPAATAPKTSGGRMGKPNLKDPLKAKLDAAGVKYKGNLTVTELQALVDKYT
ncbi:MAG: hypothetical protein V5B36_00980 [Candidatus Accumulibacter sp. UW25]|jgi:hypothetical protein